MSTSPVAVREWLKALGTLTAGSLSREEVDGKLSAYAPLLAREYGAQCFSATTLAAVARHCKFFPSFSEICEHLSAWWKEHRADDVLSIEGPENSWQAENAEVHRQVVEDWSDPGNIHRALASFDQHPMREYLGKMLGALVGRHAPQNIALLPPDFIPERFRDGKPEVRYAAD